MKATFTALQGDQADVQEPIMRVMDMLGPLLVQSLIRNIGGRGSRSELDKLSEPLKKLIVRFPMAKHWLQTAVNHDSFPSSKVTSEQKALFVRKLLAYVNSAALYLNANLTSLC